MRERRLVREFPRGATQPHTCVSMRYQARPRKIQQHRCDALELQHMAKALIPIVFSCFTSCNNELTGDTNPLPPPATFLLGTKRSNVLPIGNKVEHLQWLAPHQKKEGPSQ